MRCETHTIHQIVAESTTTLITTSMNEMAIGAGNINSAVTRVNEIGKKTKKL